MAGERKSFRSHPKVPEIKKFWGWLLIATGSLLLGAVLFVGVHFWLSHRPLELYPGSDVLTCFSPENIKPSLALLSLAGYPDAQVFQEAMEEGELETAYVTLAFSTSMEDQEKLGRWIALARAFGAKGLRRKALLSYGQAYNLTILSPYLSDSERAEALIAIGSDLKEMGEKARASFVLQQAETLVSFSPYIKKAQRVSFLQKLGREPSSETTFVELPQPVLVIHGFAQTPEEYYDAREREMAAFSSASSLTESSLQALKDKLQKEDSARLALYQERISSEKALPKKAGWIREEIAWLTLKYRIALKGFGISIVPKWEREAKAIRRELSRSYDELLAIYAEEAISFPETREVDKALAEVATLKAFYAMAGLYADAPLGKIVAEVREAYPRGQQGSLQLNFLEESKIFAYKAAK